MARQFREQLEEEVQLEEARKAQRTADSPPPVEPAPAPAPAAATAPDAGAAHVPETQEASAAGPAAAAARVAPENGGEPAVMPETFSHAHPTDATGADPTAVRPAQPPGADERRT
jgi:hypothetical protein